ncbi:hypothetical protein B9Z55_023041 [Caenorhabditis nigoni]|uniref:WAP domain-containing protein n=1 Tax=Caenorhabditis nigoni TaxID=1611254 RepID=A0A2G5SMZ2_9PELO|nr:hypothetical protein B9Z55_023041 [Caenorhabditis nigoni]
MVSLLPTFVSFYFLISLVYFVSAQAPTCPNGQLPELDSSLKPKQCLPGMSENLMCGPNHNCFFTGLNYMCCPSNEPSIDNQPSCPYPKLTVLDPHGLPLKCSQIARSCPGENMYCADVGLGYICCEDPSFQRLHHPEPTTTTRHPKQKYRVKTTTPLPEEELECPSDSIGMLNSNGSRVICNSRNPCPGTDTYCFGEYKRSICCQKYLYASDILDETTTAKPKHGLQSINMSMKKALPGKMHDGQYLKPTTTTTSTTTTTVAPTTTTQAPQELPQIAINSVGVRRKGPATAVHLKSAEVGGSATVTRTWVPRQSFTFPTPPTTTATAAPRTRPVPSAVARRNRLNGVQNFPASSADFKPASLNLERNQQNDPNRHALAQKLLSYQIRNGWPYDERFYRPDVDVYTEEQKSEIARMRFLPN